MPFEPLVINSTDTDPSLFVNRDEDFKELKLLLRQLIKAPDARGGVLLKGDSGVGKSILSRKAVADLKSEHSPKLITLEVDGGRLSGVRGLLNKLCEVANKAIAPLNRAELTKQAKVLSEIADYGKITTSEASQFSSEKSVGGKVGGGIWGLLSGEVSIGLKRANGMTATQIHEISITEDYLSKLLGALMQEVHDAGFRVLVFLDNLDRIGRMDSQEDANTIAALVKQLLEFPCCVLLLNLRTQFAHHTTDRRELRHLALGGVPSKAMQGILDTRVKAAPLSDSDRTALASVTLGDVAARLRGRTNNPLAFLRWIEFWLARTDNDPTHLDADLEKFIHHNFTGVPRPWIDKAIGALANARAQGLPDFAATELSEPERRGLESVGAIVPDNLLLDADQRRYRLHHDLDFLLPKGCYSPEK